MQTIISFQKPFQSVVVENKSIFEDFNNLQLLIEQRFSLPRHVQRIFLNDKKTPVFDQQSFAKRFLKNDINFIQIHLSLLGGKGGFGSLLKGKKQTVKTTNFSACRDLNGRRLRHVEQDKALQEWNEKAKERQLQQLKEKEEKKRKASAAASSSTRFNDETFSKETEKYTNEISDAIKSVLEENGDVSDEQNGEKVEEEVEKRVEEKPKNKKRKKSLFDDEDEIDI